MTLPSALRGKLRLPVIGAPLFIISHPSLVIAQCKAGIVGAFPALNARPASQLDEWLHEITEALAAHDRAHPESPAAPFAVNQIVHKSNARLEQDMELAVKWKAPIVITSLGAREDVNVAVHSYGGVVADLCPRDNYLTFFRIADLVSNRIKGAARPRNCAFLCLRRANPIRCEGFPFLETHAFSYPIRCELMPSEAPDQLSNLVPSTTRPPLRAEYWAHYCTFARSRRHSRASC